VVETIRFGGYQSAASVHSRAIAVFAEALERQLGGEVAIEITLNVAERGHKAADLLTLVERGEIDLCYFSSSYLAGRVPELEIVDIPFEIASREQAHAAWDGALGERLKVAIAGATGYRALAFWDNGIRHISNGARPIRSPSDCRGLRIRTQDNMLHQDAFRALGFEPVAIDPSELPGAVRDGRIDAQENPLTNLVNFGMHEHHPHVSLSAHLFGVAPVLANRARYEAWPEVVRTSVESALAEATQAQRSFAREDDLVCLATLEKAGNQVIELSEDARRVFATAIEPVAEAARRRLDPGLLDLLRAAN
jgi:tripartite ATP-independent transporter DctP family solute receptor